MYKCGKHGELGSEWCDECGEIKQCDCSQLTTQRFKDLELNLGRGSVYITIYIDYCKFCGKIINIAQ